LTVHSAKNTRVVLGGSYAFLVRKTTTSISESLELKEEFGKEMLKKLHGLHLFTGWKWILLI